MHLTINQRLIFSMKIDAQRIDDKTYFQQLKKLFLLRYT